MGMKSTRTLVAMCEAVCMLLSARTVVDQAGASCWFCMRSLTWLWALDCTHPRYPFLPVATRTKGTGSLSSCVQLCARQQH